LIVACQVMLAAATLAMPSSVESLDADVPRAASSVAVVELAAWLMACWIAAAPDDGVAVVAGDAELAAGAVDAAAPDADAADEAVAAAVADGSVAAGVLAELACASCACTYAHEFALLMEPMDISRPHRRQSART
jgi:hypothetical protein